MLGKRIKTLRKARCISLEDLSRQTGLSKGQLSKLENNQGNPTLKTLLTLSAALGTTVGYLAGETVAETSEIFGQLLTKEEALQLMPITPSYLERLLAARHRNGLAPAVAKPPGGKLLFLHRGRLSNWWKDQFKDDS